MNDLIARIANDLTAAGKKFALVGGHAVSARTEPRFTRDIDLAVAVADDRDAETLVRDLMTRGYRVLALLEQETTRRLATVRLENDALRGSIVDLLFATTGIEPEIVAAATKLRVGATLELPVATVGHLLAMKTLSVDDTQRPQDRMDITALLGAATPDDVRAAEQALARITERRFHRGRDLAAMFARMRTS